MESNFAEKLFENNRKWAEGIKREDPDYFMRLSKQQAPKYLWIGCSDSRVPVASRRGVQANVLMGLTPGEVFVHRNVANVVVHSDLSCLSVLQFAVEVLKVEHIIVCGHYGCGGVRTALGHQLNGLIDNWLRHIKDVYNQHQRTFRQRGMSQEEQEERLVELNVRQSMRNVCVTSIVQSAWQRKQPLSVHGWVYSIKTGLLREIEPGVSRQEDLPDIFQVGLPDPISRAGDEVGPSQ